MKSNVLREAIDKVRPGVVFVPEIYPPVTQLAMCSGMLIWENIFGTYNPWPVQDRRTWRQAVGILRHFADNFTSDAWEWTESCRDDGHTRFIIIRGGSYFNAEGSDWYVQGGPKPCNHHTKFIRMWPGLDRCSTIGFRCVVDAEPQ